jgi:hypothetical protein
LLFVDPGRECKSLGKVVAAGFGAPDKSRLHNVDLDSPLIVPLIEALYEIRLC